MHPPSRWSTTKGKRRLSQGQLAETRWRFHRLRRTNCQKRRYAASDNKINFSDRYSRFFGLLPKKLLRALLDVHQKHLDGSHNRARRFGVDEARTSEVLRAHRYNHIRRIFETCWKLDIRSRLKDGNFVVIDVAFVIAVGELRRDVS
jgi:hypothetical protein